MNLSLNNKLIPLTLIQLNPWISYLRKEVNYYIKDHIHYLKPLLESNLLYFVTRFYKNLEKPVRNFSCLHVFNIFPACAPPPPPMEVCLKTQASILRAGSCTKGLAPDSTLSWIPPPNITPPAPNTNVQRELRSTTDYFSYISLYHCYYSCW